MNSSSKIAWSIFLSSVTSWLTSVRPIMIIQCRCRRARHRQTVLEHRAARGKGWIFRPIGENPKTPRCWKLKYVLGQFLTLFHVVHCLRGQRTHGLKLDWCYCCCLTSLTALCIGKHTQMSVINFIPLSMHNTVGFIFFAKFLTKTVYFCYRSINFACQVIHGVNYKPLVAILGSFVLLCQISKWEPWFYSKSPKPNSNWNKP